MILKHLVIISKFIRSSFFFFFYFQNIFNAMTKNKYVMLLTLNIDKIGKNIMYMMNLSLKQNRSNGLDKNIRLRRTYCDENKINIRYRRKTKTKEGRREEKKGEKDPEYDGKTLFTRNTQKSFDIKIMK